MLKKRALRHQMLPAAKDYNALVTPERRRTRLDLFRYIFDNFQGIILKLAIFSRPYTFRICKYEKHFFKISRCM